MEDDDSFMDWETRKESICLWKHIIAGKSTRDLIDGLINILLSKVHVRVSSSILVAFL